MFEMADIDFYLDNSHQASVSYPLSSIGASINADANTDANARCGQGLRSSY